MNVSIDSELFKKNWEEINEFGYNTSSAGVNRLGYSDADFSARKWFLDKADDLGFKTRMDEVGNVYARFGKENGPCIMSGSHIDSVPEGGKYDGILGVMAAFECCRAIHAAGLNPKIAIEIVGTAEEEGRFGGMLGSQAIAGLVDDKWVENSKDANGLSLKDAMASQGLNAYDYEKCKRNNNENSDDQIKAFIELHIEQGPMLEQLGFHIGIVDSIAGTINPIFTFVGESNHSGTTPMNLRKDPMVAFTLFGSKLHQIIGEYGRECARATIGKVDVEPNFVHTIPKQVRFCVNLRDNNDSCMWAMFNAINTAAQECCDLHGCSLQRDDSLGSLTPVKLDDSLKEVIIAEADKLVQTLGIEAPTGQKRAYQVMTSGAGHDAQNLQQICPSGMIFIPSIGGVSHSPKEHTKWEDVVLGTQLLCNVLCHLSGV